MKHLVLSMATLLSMTAAASQAGAANRCLDGKLSYFKTFADMKQGPLKTAKSLWYGCSELKGFPQMTQANSWAEIALRDFQITSFGAAGHALSAFSGMNSNEAERAYKAALAKIKVLPNPMTRIQLVYELAASAQGKYDEKTMGAVTMASGLFLAWETPENILWNARTRGTAGVCREMASLLQWSLMQVSRWSGSKTMALGPNDFSSNFIGGGVPGPKGWKDGGGHAWVRVKMPTFDAKGAIAGFRHFDLDTTWYPEQFAPLVPRRSGLTTTSREKLLNQCSDAIDCLLEADANATPKPKPTPAPR